MSVGDVGQAPLVVTTWPFFEAGLIRAHAKRTNLSAVHALVSDAKKVLVPLLNMRKTYSREETPLAIKSTIQRPEGFRDVPNIPPIRLALGR